MAQFLITAPDGRKFRVTGDTREGALAALQAQLGQVQPSDTSMGTAFAVGDANTRASTMGYMADANRQLEQGPLGSVMRWGEENIAQPIANALGVDRPTYDEAQAANQAELDANYRQARGVADQLVEDTNYRSMTTDDINGLGSGLRYIGQKVAESAPAMAGAIASGGAITPALTAGEVNENLRDIEGLSEEDRIRLATTGGAINAILENAGVGLLMKGVPDSVIGKMGIRGVVNLLERNGLGRFVNRVVAGAASEGITEGMQEGVSIGAEAIGGRDFTPEQVVDRLKEAAVAGAAAGGATRGGMSTVGGVVDAVTPNARLDTPENRAAASLAQRLQGIAEANDYNLKDVSVSSTVGARETIDKAHIQLTEDLKQVFKDMRDRVKANDLDTLESVQNKVLAEAAYREGRNKTKSTVGKQELDALRQLAGDTFEGQKAENLLLELNHLTTLHNDGYKGGLSAFTDFANPFDGAGNTYNQAAQVTNRILGPLVSSTTAYATGGASILPQAGIVAAGRTVDAITGRRSRVNRFVKQNAKAEGLQTPTAPSLRMAKVNEALAKQAQAEQDQSRAEQRAAQRKALNLQLTKQNAPAALGSPQQVMEEATGLNRNGVARIIRVIEATNQDPLLKEAIDGYRKSVAEGGRVPELTPLIRAVNSMVEKQPAFKDLRVRQPNQGAAQQQFGPQQTTQENYNRGIEDNKAMLRDLKDTARTDKQLSKTDKAKILDALDQLGMNLGKDPLGKVSEIMKSLEGVDPDAIATYVAPYVDRITGQQGRTSYDQGPDGQNNPEFPTGQQGQAAQPAMSGTQTDGILRQSSGMDGAGTKPIGVAGQLAQKLSQQVAPPPSIQEVKATAADVADVFEIGKAGSPYENGIKDVDTAIRLATALDYAVQMFGDQVELRKALGGKGNDGTRGAMRLNRMPHQPKAQNLVVALKAGTAMPNGQVVSSLEEVTTLLHEISHGIVGTQDATGLYTGEMTLNNPMTGEADNYTPGTFEGAVSRILEASSQEGMSGDVARAIVEEVKNLQDNLSVYSDKGGSQARAVRGISKLMASAKYSSKAYKAKLGNHLNYVRSLPEFSVDPVWVYLYDPKMAKQVMPYTTRVIQELFKSNNTITFHSHPLAMVVAILLAMLAKGAAGDDEDQRQSPQGILSQGQGALSA